MITILIDDSRLDGAGALLFEQPASTIIAWEPGAVAPAIADLSRGLADGYHAAGYFSYDLGLVLEPKLATRLLPRRAEPLLSFGLFPPPRRLDTRGVDDWLAARIVATGAAGGAEPVATPPQPNWSLADYLERFQRAKAAITAGDIYQLNLTLEAGFALTGSPLALYRALRQRQRVAHAALIETADRTILSLSPELFLDRDGQRMTTRPMKGTAARLGLPEDDAAVGRALARDAKSRAENLMIVDLMRNDLSRIARIGSVKVPELFKVETLRTLHQMTSDVTAELLPDISLHTLLRATFPAGSITGAPKIRAMELIAELEQRSRGVYCGSIGWLGPDDRAQFNVAIRTIAVDAHGQARIGIGSGVVADSDGAAEYAECLLKMRFLTTPQPPFGLFETLLLDGAAGYGLLERHLSRLAASACYFQFRFDEAAARDLLAATARESGDTRQRVRLDLAEDGTLSIRTAPAPARQTAMRFVIADAVVDPDDVHLYHKTTSRVLYDQARAALARQNPSADEMLFLNCHGEATEGTITNIFLERNGRLLTPPIVAGLLPGTLRAELIESGRAVEGRLTRRDLTRGPIWLGNALRGLVPGRFAGVDEGAPSDSERMGP